MTSRERLLTACRRGIPDRIPHAIVFEHGFAADVKRMLKKENPGLDVERLDLAERHVSRVVEFYIIRVFNLILTASMLW